MNALVYSGPGTTAESVKHCLESLKHHLSPYYAVVPISEKAILKDPWMSKCAVLVIPGGADLPYCQELNGEGTKKISQFVRKGGKFLGICAGGYFSSAKVEFEVGDPKMEVSGPRELKFFPGIAKGCAFKGFVYDSHDGAKVARLGVDPSRLPQAQAEVSVYYNGGCIFLDASKFSSVDILAKYLDPTDVQDDDKAAVVLCKVGQGKALLTGAHPEYTPGLLSTVGESSVFASVVELLKQHDRGRKVFMKECLRQLGLRVNEDVDFSIPKITPVFLSSYLAPERLTQLKQKLHDNLDFVNGNTLEDSNDTLCFHDESEDDHDYFMPLNDSEAQDPQACIKHFKLLTTSLPNAKETPFFNMNVYYSHLKELYGAQEIGEFGTILGYAEVVSSTSTMLDGNPKLLAQLPSGFTLTATTQVAGRGRGGNVWVNPKGVMAQSILFKIPPGTLNQLSLVTLQYLSILAVTELILNYGSTQPGQGAGYEDMPIKIKWPNDLYILKSEYFTSLDSKKRQPSDNVDGDEECYAKVSGSLVNSQFLNGQFHLVLGVGVNVSNLAPTTSLNIVLEKLNQLREASGQPRLAPYKHELLLAKLMYTINQFYAVFIKSGFEPFLPLYYKRWFHTSQKVRVDESGDGTTKTCIIKGITPDYGLLVAEDVQTQQVLHLQPDGNSFDIFKGLVYKKS